MMLFFRCLFWVKNWPFSTNSCALLLYIIGVLDLQNKLLNAENALEIAMRRVLEERNRRRTLHNVLVVRSIIVEPFFRRFIRRDLIKLWFCLGIGALGWGEFFWWDTKSRRIKIMKTNPVVIFAISHFWPQFLTLTFW